MVSWPRLNITLHVHCLSRLAWPQSGCWYGCRFFSRLVPKDAKMRCCLPVAYVTTHACQECTDTPQHSEFRNYQNKNKVTTMWLSIEVRIISSKQELVAKPRYGPLFAVPRHINGRDIDFGARNQQIRLHFYFDFPANVYSILVNWFLFPSYPFTLDFQTPAKFSLSQKTVFRDFVLNTSNLRSLLT